jgi:hypothetical protein
MGEMNRLAIRIHAQQDSRSSQSAAPQAHEQKDDTYDEPRDLFARAVTAIVKAMHQLAQG